MKKSNPIGVRFDLYKLDMIQKEQNLTSVQKVVNYLMDNYQSISTSKTLLEIIDLKDEPNILGIGSNLDDVRKSVQISVQSEKKPKLEPPSHLTGIDLVIWKAENGK